MTVICYSYFSCDYLRIVGNTILRCASFYFLDGVSISTCFIEGQFIKLNFSSCIIFLSFNVTSLVCQRKFELIFLSSCCTTSQLLSHFKNGLSISCFISIDECLNSGICNGVDGTRDWRDESRTKC